MHWRGSRFHRRGTRGAFAFARETRFGGEMLRALTDDVWVCEQPLRFAGLSVGARMTVLRVRGGALWLHSPVRPTDELRAAVDALGTVTYLVAPNRFHHLFIGRWMEAYPAARAFAAPGLPAKRKDLAFHGVIDDAAGEWAPEIEHVCWRGVPMMNEVAFFHRKSRTLVLTDAVHNFVERRPFMTRVVFGMIGGYGGFKSTAAEKLLARDRPASRASLDRILAWDFDRVIMSHGEVLDQGGPDALRAAYAWLKP
jgi:Domain of unknown function (DUF4336)